MKKFLFDVVAELGQLLIIGSTKLFELLIDGLDFIGRGVVWGLANFFKIVLSVLDPVRIEHAEHVAEQRGMNLELEILGTIAAVKEDALKRELWTPKHSQAINILVNRLLNECDWEEDRVHDYVRRVIEDIPGLGYAVESGDDEGEGIPIRH